MSIHKMDRKALTVYRIRCVLVAFPFAVLVSVFLQKYPVLFWSGTAVWVLGLLFYYLFYYPIKFKKFSLLYGDDVLIINSGVIYTRNKYLKYSSVEYMTVYRSPLQRLFGVCTIALYSAGLVTFIPGLSVKDADALKDLVSKVNGKDGEKA